MENHSKWWNPKGRNEETPAVEGQKKSQEGEETKPWLQPAIQFCLPKLRQRLLCTDRTTEPLQMLPTTKLTEKDKEGAAIVFRDKECEERAYYFLLNLVIYLVII